MRAWRKQTCISAHALVLRQHAKGQAMVHLPPPILLPLPPQYTTSKAYAARDSSSRITSQSECSGSVSNFLPWKEYVVLHLQCQQLWPCSCALCNCNHSMFHSHMLQRDLFDGSRVMIQSLMEVWPRLICRQHLANVTEYSIDVQISSTSFLLCAQRCCHRCTMESCFKCILALQLQALRFGASTCKATYNNLSDRHAMCSNQQSSGAQC